MFSFQPKTNDRLHTTAIAGKGKTGVKSSSLKRMNKVVYRHTDLTTLCRVQQVAAQSDKYLLKDDLLFHPNR